MIFKCPLFLHRATAAPLLAMLPLLAGMAGQAAAADTSKPTAPVLSAAPGDKQVALTWTAATDNVGVTRYAVWKDNASVAGLGSSARSYTVTDLTPGVSHRFRVIAYDAANNYTSSNKVTAAAAAADTTKPAAPILSATPGDEQVTLDWTAATDNVGVTRYEVWKDDAYVTGVAASILSYTVTGLAAGISHSFKIIAYDAAGNFANSNTVIDAATNTPTPFPSRLKVSGRNIVDENGYVLPTLRGFNMHVSPTFVWSQAHFDAIAALGGKINRAVLHWDAFEPTQGVVSTSAIANLDLHIARAQAAGIYTLLELHLNVGRTPSWTSDKATEMERYAAYGQALTQYLAFRYGNPASPTGTKAVIGFGLNEPPLEDSTIRNGNSSIPYLEGKQRQMISWFRGEGYAPGWIGFVAYGYASATPIYNDSAQNPNAIDASPTAYDAVGGNVVIDIHDYMAYCTNDDPDCEGRQWNGMPYPTTQGGALMRTGSLGATPYTSSTIRQSQHRAFLKPYETFSIQANIPLMVGEWGWPSSATGGGETDWITDKKAAWTGAATVIQIHWNYDVSSSNTVWAARPGGVWRTSVTSLFADK